MDPYFKRNTQNVLFNGFTKGRRKKKNGSLFFKSPKQGKEGTVSLKTLPLLRGSLSEQVADI